MEDFVDMEGDVQPAKGQYDLPKRKTKSKVETPKFTEQEKRVIDLYPQYNENQIAGMLMIPLQSVKEILDR